MRHILIVSESFAPLNVIGAIRPTKLAKYLYKNGYEVTVFTSVSSLRNGGNRDFPFRVIYAGEQKEPAQVACSSDSLANRDNFGKKALSPLVRELKMTKRQIISYREGLGFADLLLRSIASGEVDINKTDCIFSTFGPVGSLLAAMGIKKKYKDIVWINDFRDPMVSQIMPRLSVPYYYYLQKKSIRLADYSTTVSNGYAKRMSFRSMKKPIKVIPNGYDKEDVALIENSESDYKFSFACVGTLYEGKRDVSIIFKLLAQLVNEKKIKKSDIAFHYAGGDSLFLLEQAERFKMAEVVIDHKYVSRVESMRIQSLARFLVLATWNDKGEEGVFPGKLLEYMLMDKPVVSVVGGNLPHSEVTETIKKNNLGVSYEKADPHTEEELKIWLQMQINQYLAGKQALFNPDRRSISEQYDWENIAERFRELIDGKEDFLRS